MSVTSRNEGESIPRNSGRVEKWILWNLHRPGRSYDRHRKEVAVVHRIDRVKGWVWKTALVWLLRSMKHERANEPTAFQAWAFFILGIIVSSLPALFAGLILFWLIGLSAIWKLLASIARLIRHLRCIRRGSPGWHLSHIFFRRWFRSFTGGNSILSVWAIWLGLVEISATTRDAAKVLIDLVGGLYVMVRTGQHRTRMDGGRANPCRDDDVKAHPSAPRLSADGHSNRCAFFFRRRHSLDRT